MSARSEAESQWQPTDPVARLLSDDLAKHDEGEWPVAVDRLCIRHPELGERLRQLFAQMQVSGLVGDREQHAAQQLGNYRLVRRLGAGGMGVVWEADQGPTGRKVALKLIRPELLESESAHRRFRREVELAASLEHPNICTVYEAGSVEGQPFLAMQLVVGDNLATRLRTGPLPLPLAVAIVERIAQALDAAHQKGLVHRDVKPANVILRRDDVPVLIDFGLARGIDAESGGLTMTGEIVGTPAYLAPEQIEPRVGPIDARTDIYGLGITLFELITGRLPFAAPTRDALYRRILTGDHHHTGWAGARLPRDLQAIVETAIDHEPARRYATARALADDLARFSRHEPVQARRAGPVLRLVRWSQRNRAAAALLAVLSLALAVVVWSLYRASESLADSQQRQLVLASVEAARADPMLALHLARVAVDRRADFAAVTQLAAAVRSATETLHLDLPFAAGAQEILPDGEGGFWCRGADANRAAVASVVHWQQAGGMVEMPTAAPVQDLAVHTDGRVVVVLTDERACELVASTWVDIAHGIRMACFSRTGTLVLADRAGSLVLHRDGSSRSIDLGNIGAATALESHPDRGLLLVGTGRGELLAVDETTGKCDRWSILQSGQPEQAVQMIRSSPDSRWVGAQSARAQHIAVVDLDAPGAAVRCFGGRRQDDPIVAFGIAGNRLATSHRDQVVRVRDLVTDSATALTGATAWVMRMHVDGAHDRLAGGCGDGSILVWDLVTGKVTHRVRGAGNGPSSLAIDAATARLLVAQQVGPLRAYALTQPQTPRLRSHVAGARWCIALPDAGPFPLVTWAADGSVHGWDGIGGPRPLAGAGHELVTCASSLPVAGMLVAIDSAGQLRSWSAAGAPVGEPCGLPEATSNWTRIIGLAPDRLLVSSGEAKQPRRFWHLVHDGTMWREEPLPAGLPDPAGVWGLAASPDGSEILLGHDDGTATHVAHAAGAFTQFGRLSHREGAGIDESYVQLLAISTDRQRLLSGGNDRIARLWHRDGRLVATLSGHEEMLVHVAFSPDGERIATLSADEAWLWDRHGKPVFRIQTDGGAFAHCAFLADSRRLAITSTDGSVWVEPVAVEDIVAAARRRQTRAIAAEVLAPYADLLDLPAKAGRGQ